MTVRVTVELAAPFTLTCPAGVVDVAAFPVPATGVSAPLFPGSGPASPDAAWLARVLAAAVAGELGCEIVAADAVSSSARLPSENPAIIATDATRTSAP
ncbi:MAG: hypothetical protein EPN48_16035 [Microbacteriaceae bacterium]|nr:MAG: hypothetical protein EPN48_16035 [Microbacteriaceae bacterium]